MSVDLLVELEPGLARELFGIRKVVEVLSKRLFKGQAQQIEQGPVNKSESPFQIKGVCEIRDGSEDLPVSLHQFRVRRLFARAPAAHFFRK